MIFKKQYNYLNKKDIRKLSCLFCFDGTSLLSLAFSNLPLPIQQHSIKVGSLSGLMAKFIPENRLPYGMKRDEFADAVRYGAQYHDIAAYLVYNMYERYPSSGERFLREQTEESIMGPLFRRVALETVKYSCERYDGAGYPDGVSGDNIPIHASICAVANTVDDYMASAHHILNKKIINEAQKYITENKEIIFSSPAVECFTSSIAGIIYLYKLWRRNPPKTTVCNVKNDYIN